MDKPETSHLLQMRGLKRIIGYYIDTFLESHLLQMRGLKLRLLNVVLCKLGRIFYRCVD